MKSNSLPRIGVVLCYCGNEIRDALDFVRIEDYVRALPGVVYVKPEAYPCSRPGIVNLVKAIKENQIERVVVAGCTPRLHGKLVAEACESAGLNRWLVDVANVREHCVRVHGDKTKATEKAKALIGASVRKVALARPYEPVKVRPTNSVLVIGGGVSGLSAAAELGDLNHNVILIEKKDTLGGMLLRLARPYPYGKTGTQVLEEKMSRIHGKVRILKRAELVSLSGGPGRYLAKLSIDGKTDDEEVGAIVVATGADCVGLKEVLEEPSIKRISGFGGHLVTQIDLETEAWDERLKGARSIVFLNIAMPRLSHSSSRVYSLVALKNAGLLKEANPGLEVWFMFRDVPADLEREFITAKHAGTQFVRLEDGKSLKFFKNGIRIENEPEITADVIVLPTFLRPSPSSSKLAELLGTPVDTQGFFIEPQIKLRPGDFVEKGVFVAGCCHSPATVLESIAQAVAAASRASRFISGEIVRAPLVSKIDRRVCRGCSRCAEACRWDAIEMVALENGLKLALVDETRCTGCGVCSTVCINGAPSLAPVSQEQVRAMVEVAVS